MHINFCGSMPAMTTPPSASESPDMTRVLVVGAGGIGGLLAARLSSSPHLQVSLAVRRPTPALSFEQGGVPQHPPVQVVQDPGLLESTQWVIVATKAHDVGGVAGWLRAEACREARVGVAQNGIEHADRLAPFVDPGRVVPLIITYGAERPRPGCIVQTLDGVARVPDTDGGREFADLARGSTLKVEPVTDFDSALRTKLIWNHVATSLTTLANVPIRDVAHRPALRDLGERMVSECLTVARAHDVVLPETFGSAMMEMFGGFSESVHSSMWQDLRAGRPLEHRAISGAVIRAADRVGLSVPHSRTVAALLAGISGERKGEVGARA